jgi:alanine racemase
MSRPAKAQLNLEALRNNIAHVRALAPQSKVMAVVKANAYGHGAVVIAQTLAPLADALAVACIEEALELRAAGISAPILLLEGIFETDEVHIAAAENFWLCIDNEWQLNVLEQEKLQQPVQTWLKIDTGMHRLGIAPERASNAYKRLKNSANVLDDLVLCTHFASADDLQSSQTREQLELFNKVCKTLPGLRSAANSPGVLGWPASHFDWVRPGYMLYGNSPLMAQHDNAEALQAVMTLSSNIISLREVAAGEPVGYGATWTSERPSRIATVTIGYGDGYPRLARNGTPVLVNGQRASLAGRVSMDMITIDVTHLTEVSIGDEVILWGEGLPLAEVAACAGTIGYELTTRMPARTRRLVSKA